MGLKWTHQKSPFWGSSACSSRTLPPAPGIFRHCKSAKRNPGPSSSWRDSLSESGPWTHCQIFWRIHSSWMDSSLKISSRSCWRIFEKTWYLGHIFIICWLYLASFSIIFLLWRTCHWDFLQFLFVLLLVSWGTLTTRIFTVYLWVFEDLLLYFDALFIGLSWRPSHPRHLSEGLVASLIVLEVENLPWVIFRKGLNLLVFEIQGRTDMSARTQSLTWDPVHRKSLNEVAKQIHQTTYQSMHS